MRANEQTDERVAQYLRLDSYLFQTIVRRGPHPNGLQINNDNKDIYVPIVQRLRQLQTKVAKKLRGKCNADRC